MPPAVTQSGPSGRLALLPPSFTEALWRLSRQLFGLLLVAGAAALALVLASFSASDPSLNTSASGDIRNLLGAPGARISDVLLQSFGLASGVIPLALAAWSIPFLRGRGHRLLWLRFLILPLTLAFSALALTWFAPPEAWPFKVGFGGATGGFLLNSIFDLTVMLGATWITVDQIAGAGAVLAVFSLFPLLAIGPRFLGALIPWVFGLFWSTLRWIFTESEKERAASGRSKNKRRSKTKKRVEPKVRRAADADEDLPPAPKFLVTPPKAKPKKSRRAESESQGTLSFSKSSESYKIPELNLLATPPRSSANASVDQDALSQNAQLLESVLKEFGVKGNIVKIRPGPVVALYEFVPAPGTKSSRVIGLSDDIARSMSAISVRVAVIPGRNAIGIELPNMRRELVMLRDLLESASYERASARLPLVLGKDIGGSPVIADLARMPHMLIAGTTGSGKSVAINTMILSLLYRLTPEQCKFIMIDPKMLELSVYDGIPQLLAPVVTEPHKAIVALKWAVREMENRYQVMAKLGVRNIEGHNSRVAEARRKGEVLRRRVQTGFDSETGKPTFEDQPIDLKPLPHIVIVVDEMADLMLVAGKDIEAAVQRLAQMARAAGLHLIMATQRPSVDVITGTIKANFPTRVSFQVTSKIDSRTILGEQGAETLLGHGDMLYMAGGGRITRVHGPFVSDQEVEGVVGHLKAQGEPAYIESITEEEEELSIPGFSAGGNSAEDALYQQAVELVLREGKASTSFVQRHLQIGYNRAARLIERMEADGLISRANHVGRREILANQIE